jgi:hypothetical protein
VTQEHLLKMGREVELIFPSQASAQQDTLVLQLQLSFSAYHFQVMVKMSHSQVK